MKPSLKRVVACRCGRVKIELAGRPFLVSLCHCDDCRRGSAEIEQLAGAPEILDSRGGTPYALYRKDRIKLIAGGEVLVDRRITGEKRTRRVVASCCNSPLFLDFEPGHWVSVYLQRFDVPAPEPTMRLHTRFMPPGDPPDDTLPRYRGFAPAMIARLLAAWVAMGFRRPNIGT